MPATSEARIIANRRNATRSTGPRTEAGKERSKRNGLKHGLSGSGVVVAEEDVSEIDRRGQALMRELDPRSTLGQVLIGQLATLSVRMERGARQEEAALASRVRHAAEDFDQARLDRAETLFETLAEAPRERLRELVRSPEGIDRLVLAWGELRDALTLKTWDSSRFETLANLVGLRGDDPRAAGLQALSDAIQGIGRNDQTHPIEARNQILKRIADEVEALQEHRETLDLESIELDRAGSADVALFDPSREATLARRYEAEARRGFFRALKEFRQAEAEAADRPSTTPGPGPVEEPETVETPSPLGSSRAERSPTLREPRPAVANLRDSADSPAKTVAKRGESLPVSPDDPLAAPASRIRA